MVKSLGLDCKNPIAEDTTYLGHRTYRIQAGTQSEVSFLLASIRRSEKCYTYYQREKRRHQSYPAVSIVSHNNDCLGHAYPLVQEWHEHHRSHQPLSDCI